jgi:hypothetical protein
MVSPLRRQAPFEGFLRKAPSFLPKPCIQPKPRLIDPEICANIGHKMRYKHLYNNMLTSPVASAALE